MATPSGLNAILTVATNPTLFERGRDFASKFIEGLTSEATRLPNLSPSDWGASQVGEFFGNSIREVGTNIFAASLHYSSSQMLNLQNLSAFTVEPQNFGNFQ